MLLFIIIFAVALVPIYNKWSYRSCRSSRVLEGKTALVTGGTAGMGLIIATDLAARGARVIVACPFPQEGEQGKKTIILETGNRNVEFRLLDLASLQSVRNFAASIKITEKRLDILVNNAGLADAPNKFTADGINFLMQVNYYGHFLLTLLLLPLLKKTGTKTDPARIVNTSSSFHHFGTYKLINGKPGEDGVIYHRRLYGTSKLCMAWFAKELTKRLTSANVVANSVDPGTVGTKIYYSFGSMIGFLTEMVYKVMFKTPWQGAQTAIHVAVDEDTGKVSGKFFQNCQVISDSAAVRDQNAEKIWQDSLQIVKLSEEEIECR